VSRGKIFGEEARGVSGRAGGPIPHIACLEVFPECEPVPQPTFEDCFQAVCVRRSRACDDSDREFFGRPRRRHSSPVAHLRSLHHRRAFHAGAPPAFGACAARRPAIWRWCRAIFTRSVNAEKSSASLAFPPRVAADTAGSARYVAELGDPKRAAARAAPRSGDLRPSTFFARTLRTNPTTPRASSCCRGSRSGRRPGTGQ